MHPTGSMILTILERIRAIMDSPIEDAKYTNDYMTRHIIMPEMVNVLSRLNLNADNPIVSAFSFTTVSGQRYYQMPPSVGEILQVSEEDTDGRIIKTARFAQGTNPRSSGWQVEGNVLTVRPEGTLEPRTYNLWYIHNGDFMPHYCNGTAPAQGTLANDAAGDLKVVQLGTPTNGAKDMRENAYAGSMMRVLSQVSPASAIIQERIIESHDPAANSEGGEITLRRPLTGSYAAASKISYEIAPAGSQPLYQAIAMGGAMYLGTAKGISEKKMRFLNLQYRHSLKTIGDNLSQMKQDSDKSNELSRLRIMI